jgi:hypothetical protein
LRKSGNFSRTRKLIWNEIPPFETYWAIFCDELQKIFFGDLYGFGVDEPNFFYGGDFVFFHGLFFAERFRSDMTAAGAGRAQHDAWQLWSLSVTTGSAPWFLCLADRQPSAQLFPKA